MTDFMNCLNWDLAFVVETLNIKSESLLKDKDQVAAHKFYVLYKLVAEAKHEWILAGVLLQI